MRDGGRYIAIDWGTTNRRAYLIERRWGGARHVPRRSRRAGGGARPIPGELAAFARAARTVAGDRRGHGRIDPRLAGSTLRSRARRSRHPCCRARRQFGARTSAIVPGVSLRAGTRADVMRGEEVQVLGAVAAGLAPADALFSQPGTHNKWIETAGAASSTCDRDDRRTLRIAARTTASSRACSRPRSRRPVFRDGVARGAGATRPRRGAVRGTRAGAALHAGGRRCRCLRQRRADRRGRRRARPRGRRRPPSRERSLADLYAVAIEACRRSRHSRRQPRRFPRRYPPLSGT